MDKSQAMKVMAESHRETVEELEEEINHLKDVIKGNKVIVDIASYELKVLEKENKRYRDQLEQFRTEARQLLFLDRMYNPIKIIDEVYSLLWEDES